MLRWYETPREPRRTLAAAEKREPVGAEGKK